MEGAFRVPTEIHHKRLAFMRIPNNTLFILKKRHKKTQKDRKKVYFCIMIDTGKGCRKVLKMHHATTFFTPMLHLREVTN